MKTKVIEVVINGETKYLSSDSPSAFSPCLVDSPLEAHNFLAEPTSRSMLRSDRVYDPDKAILDTLHDLRMEKDAWFAKSGLFVDACYTVEFEIEIKEVNRKIGRLPHQSNIPQGI